MATRHPQNIVSPHLCLFAARHLTHVSRVCSLSGRREHRRRAFVGSDDQQSTKFNPYRCAHTVAERHSDSITKPRAELLTKCSSDAFSKRVSIVCADDFPVAATQLGSVILADCCAVSSPHAPADRVASASAHASTDTVTHSAAISRAHVIPIDDAIVCTEHASDTVAFCAAEHHAHARAIALADGPSDEHANSGSVFATDGRAD